MTKEEILTEMDECLNCASISGYGDQVDNLLNIYNDEEVSLILAQYLMEKYSRFKADGLASYMEAAIRKRPNLAMINHPENPLFKLAIIRGSKDLYDCYMEEAVLPFLSNVVEDEHQDHYYELLSVAEKMDEMIFKNYEPRIKGLHYNSGVKGIERQDRISISQEDYAIIENTLEAYNSIVGRREILEDLNARIENQV
jgi:hypothetical protein